MFLNLSTLALVLCVVGILLMRLEFPAVAGPVYASGAQERWGVKLLIPLLVIAGLGLPFFLEEDYGSLLCSTVPSTDPHAIVVIALGAAAGVGISAVIHRRTAVPYAVIGALFGYRFMAEGSLNWPQAGGMVMGWLLAPVLCFVLTFLLVKMLYWYASRPGRHLAVVDQRLLAGCVLASLLLVASATWNLGQLASGTVPAGVALGMMALLFLFRAQPSLEDDTDFGPGSALAVMLAMSASFVLFSWSGLQKVGLMPTPLSASALLVAGLVGVSVAQRNAVISGEDILKSSAASLSAPVLGFLITYCLSMVLSTLILVGIIAVAAAFILYVRAQRADARRTEMLRSREEQLYSTQKSLSALEVRVETNEKDLMNKLENKRKVSTRTFLEEIRARM